MILASKELERDCVTSVIRYESVFVRVRGNQTVCVLAYKLKIAKKCFGIASKAFRRQGAVPSGSGC